MKQEYVKPDMEHVVLESEEPVTAPQLGTTSNPFLNLDYED